MLTSKRRDIRRSQRPPQGRAGGRFTQWEAMHLSPNYTTLIRSLPRAVANLAASLVVSGVAFTNTAAGAESPAKASPAPQLLPAEKSQRDRLDAALAPLRSISPDSEDLAALRDAAAAVRAEDASGFTAAKSKIGDPVGRKLADWIRLRSGLADPAEYQTFLRDNPAWPDRSTMTQRLEEALFTHGGSAKSIESYFQSSMPETGAGYAALASANLADGDTDKARKLAAKAWREMTIPPTLENGFLDRFGTAPYACRSQMAL